MLLLPCHPFQYEAGGNTFYPAGMENVPKPFAIVRVNQYMVRNSDFLICYSRGYVGNTRKLVDMALRRETKGLIRVTNSAISCRLPASL